MVYFNNEPIVKGKFPNNELIFSLPKGKGPHVLKLVWESNEDLFNILFYKKMLDDWNYKEVSLLIYFFPYGQMDRPIDDMVFSFKYVAQLINEANFYQVFIYDPHSRVIEAAINKSKIIYPDLPIGYDLIFYPDMGAESKYSEIYSCPYRFGNKKRDLTTGKIISYEIVAEPDDIKDKKILIRDDLIIYGGSYKYAAQVLREMGAASIDLYITHVMPSARDFWTNSHKMYGIDNVYSANTLEIPWVDSKEPAAASEVDESANN